MAYTKEKHAQYELKRYHRRRDGALVYLGNRCIKCGSIENLEFDHIDPKTKEFNISRLWSISEDAFWKEIDKCQVLCNPCHTIKTISEDREEIRHGDYGYYKHRKCRCNLCVEANNAYMRDYRSRCRVDKLVKSAVFETVN